jgi:hypothetical protein
VVLERTRQEPWTPDACPTSSKAGLLEAGGSLAFRLPAGADVERGRDIDYGIAILHYGDHSLIVGDGPHWSTGLPSLEGVVELTERDVMAPWDVSVGEYRGVRADGSHWRYIGLFGATAEYDGADADAASYFDSVLDSLCWVTSQGAAAAEQEDAAVEPREEGTP